MKTLKYKALVRIYSRQHDKEFEAGEVVTYKSGEGEEDITADLDYLTTVGIIAPVQDAKDAKDFQDKGKGE